MGIKDRVLHKDLVWHKITRNFAKTFIAYHYCSAWHLDCWRYVTRLYWICCDLFVIIFLS